MLLTFGVVAPCLSAVKISSFPKLPYRHSAKVQFLHYDEGLCVQCMHVGSYDTEPETLEQMDAFAREQGYETDFTGHRRHHEIYLSDPRRTAPEKLKTVLRHPVRVK